jgi:hypothetical protein
MKVENISQPNSSLPDPYRLGDYEWYACDGVGHVAVFTTGGAGPIPTTVLGSLKVADFLADSVWKMKPQGKAMMLASLPRPDDYLHFSGCGFFAYDWSDVHRSKNFLGCYEMLSRPSKPIHLSELPETFRPLLQSTTISNVAFAETNLLDARKYFECKPEIKIGS